MKIEIRGLKCNHCKANAEKAILGLNGVKEVNIELATGKTQITGGSDLDEVKKAVEALGFEIVSSEC